MHPFHLYFSNPHLLPQQDYLLVKLWCKCIKINFRRLSHQLHYFWRTASFSSLLINSSIFLRALVYATGVVDISMPNEISLNFELCSPHVERLLLINSRKWNSHPFALSKFLPCRFNKAVEIGSCLILKKTASEILSAIPLTFLNAELNNHQNTSILHNLHAYTLMLPAQLVSAEVDHRCLWST